MDMQQVVGGRQVPTLLDITKVPRLVLEEMSRQMCQEAEATQVALGAIVGDEQMTQVQKMAAFKSLLGADLEWLVNLHNEKGSMFGKHTHEAAHQLIDECNKAHEMGVEACKPVVFAFHQMVVFGFRLANAYLQNCSLEQSAQ